jgi:hypothetical protein
VGSGGGDVYVCEETAKEVRKAAKAVERKEKAEKDRKENSVRQKEHPPPQFSSSSSSCVNGSSRVRVLFYVLL